MQKPHVSRWKSRPPEPWRVAISTCAACVIVAVALVIAAAMPVALGAHRQPPDRRASRPTCRPAASTLACAARRAGLLIGIGREAGNPADDALAAQQFDAMTLETSLIWSVVEPTPNHWNFAAADRSVAFARRHHLYLTATHFVWDQIVYASTPPWVEQITAAVQLRAVMAEHLRVITHRYGGAINRWIVVNEPLNVIGDTAAIHENVFSRVLGRDWIGESFRIAHREAPRASLWLNEDFTETDAAKANALVGIARSLVAEHAPINGVALQGHLFSPVPLPLHPVAPNAGLVQRTLRRLAGLGLQVSFTEVDAPTLSGVPNRFAEQSARITTLVNACLAVRRCTSITFWDLRDSESWLGSLFALHDLAPTLFFPNGQPHLAFSAVRHALLGRRSAHAADPTPDGWGE